MSADVAVEVRGLGKRYEIGADQGSYMLLTERLTQRVKSLADVSRARSSGPFATSTSS